MAFLRFTRDKRGYENFYLVQPATGRRGKGQTRVLYFFRTPPNVRVGREPFDDHIRRALEAHNPGVEFDWKTIVETPIPPVEVERWRERRRVDRAEKAARRAALPGEEVEPVSENFDDRIEADAIDSAAIGADESGTEALADAKPPHDLSRAGVRRKKRRRARRGRPAVQTETQAAEQDSDPHARSDEDPQ